MKLEEACQREREINKTVDRLNQLMHDAAAGGLHIELELTECRYLNQPWPWPKATVTVKIRPDDVEL